MGAATLIPHAFAQCPAYPPMLNHDRPMIYQGEITACTNVPPDRGISCQSGENITFTVVPATGRQIQSCDVVRWAFSDGSTTTTPGDGSVTHAFVAATWSDADRRVAVTMTVTNDLGAAGAGVQFYFPLPCFTRVIQSAATSSFIGPKSGCTQAGGTCAVGEQVKFSTLLNTGEASACHKWYVSWGDGTDVEIATIVEPTAHVELRHYFAKTGEFDVSFELLGPTPPTPNKTGAGQATVSVTVTEHGSPPPPRHRSAGH